MGGQQGIFLSCGGLCEQEGMELVHESIIQRCKILEAVRTIFLEAFEEEDLGAWIQLFKQAAELCHRITAGGNAQHIMHQPFDELLSDILAGDEAFGNPAGCEVFVEGDRLCCKGERLLRAGGHAEIPSLRMIIDGGIGITVLKPLRSVKWTEAADRSEAKG